VVLKEIKDPYGRPTDVIGFGPLGRDVANALLPIVGRKEICFFDERIKSDPVFHYLDFVDMLEKTEIMIFTIELPNEYYNQLNKLNKEVKIFIPKNLVRTIAILEERQFGDNLVLL
jgi:lactate dehydrogenase-like 2-hydroxyacid dehydrogenase